MRRAIILTIAFFAIALYQLRIAADGCWWSPDEAVYLFQGKVFASGMVTAPIPPEPEAFRIPMVLDHEGKRFGKYYPGYPLLLAVGEKLGVPWLLNPLLGALTILGTFLLGRALWGSLAGALAAVLIACSPLHRAMSTTYLSHVPCGFLMLASVLLLLRARTGMNWAWGVASGFLCGWAVAARPYSGLLLFLPVAGVFLVMLRSCSGRALRIGLAFGLGALPWVAAILLWNRHLTGNAFASAYTILKPSDRLGFHEIPRVPGYPTDYYSPAVAWQTTLRQLRSLGETFLPLPFSGLILFGLPLLFWRSLGVRAVGLWGAMAVLIAGHFFYAGSVGLSTIILGPRYYSEALPAMVLLVATPLAGIAAWNRWGAALVSVVVTALVLFTAIHSVPQQVRAFRMMHTQPMASSNRILERFLSSLDGGPRLTFVDISTYHRSSALLLNRPDLTGNDVIAIYREPRQNRAVMDAFPDRVVYLFRWDRLVSEVQYVEYDPEKDMTGPPAVFPYTRKEFRSFDESEPEDEDGDGA
jgi:hypothetical protein